MGSGKSTVSEVLRTRGFAVLDADRMAHLTLSPGSPGEAEVFKIFGEVVMGTDGNLDRRALAAVVFNNKTELARLEALIHPMVREAIAQMRADLVQQGNAVAFYDVPLLFEKSMQSQFDSIWVVTSPQVARLQRLKDRSSLTAGEVEERTRHHVPEAEKVRQASVVIQNNGSLEDLIRAIDQALSTQGLTLPAATKPQRS